MLRMKALVFIIAAALCIGVLFSFSGCKKEEPVTETSAPLEKPSQELIEEEPPEEISKEPEVPVEEKEPVIEEKKIQVEEAPPEPEEPVIIVKEEEPPEKIVVEVPVEEVPEAPEASELLSFSISVPKTEPEKEDLINIFTGEKAESMSDNIPPAIDVTEPAGSKYFSPVETITGVVLDSESAADDESGTIMHFTYSSSDPALQEERIQIFKDGRFSFQINTEDVSGDFEITLKAEDLSGNITRKTLSFMEDTRGPFLSLITPASGTAEIGSYTVVAGEVRNEIDLPDTDKVGGVFYSIGDSGEWSPAEITGKGLYYFGVNLPGDAGPEDVLRIRAEDLKGHYSEKEILLVTEKEGPEIVFSSHEEEGIYNSGILIEGAFEKEESQAPVSLTYTFLKERTEPKLVMTRNGAFTLDLDMEGRKGAEILLMKARDISGREGERALILKDDGVGPFLELTAPEEGALFETYTAVRGRVTNSETEKGTAEEVAVLSWEIPGVTAREKLDFNQNGTFRYEIPMFGLFGEKQIVIAALDKNGNESRKTVSLYQEEIKDTEGPEPQLKLTAPEDKGFYRDSLVLEGRVLNDDEEADSADDIKYMYYHLKNGETTRIEEVFFDLDGTFYYSIPSELFQGKQELILTARRNSGTKISRSVTLFDGKVKPELSLLTPEDKSEYGALFRVQGKVVYPDPEISGERGIRTVNLEIMPEIYEEGVSSYISREITPDENGNFDVIVSGRELTGNQLVKLSADAWNGNSAEKLVFLYKGSSGIPSFSLTGSDKTITAFWDQVPTAVSYSLLVSSDEGEETIDNPESPYLIQDLVNGNRYTIQLKAVLPEDTEPAASGALSAIPLNTELLKPEVKGEYGQIRLSWQDIPGGESYTVLRGESEKGPYLPVAENLENPLYVDTDVRFKQRYYYRIQPSLAGSIRSDWSEGTTIATPLVKMDLIGRVAGSDIRQMIADGPYLYVASGSEGLQIYDVTNPFRPVLTAVIPAEDARSIDIAGDYAYIANGTRGLLIADITNPIMPEVVGSRKTSDANHVAVRETLAYVSDGEYGVKIIDISNPKNPERVGSIKTSNARKCIIKDDFLYLADGEDGIRIYSFQGTSLKKAGLYDSENALDIELEGDLLYCADGGGGMIILNISDKEFPTLAGSFKTGYAKEIEIEGRHAFILDDKRSITVLDVFNPLNPRVFEKFKITEASGLTIEGEMAFIAEDDAISMIRINTTGSSYLVGSRPTGGLSYNVSLFSSYAFVADHQGGVKIIDVSEPMNLHEQSAMMTCETDFAEDLLIRRNYLFVADGLNGMKVFSLAKLQTADPGIPVKPDYTYQTSGNCKSISMNGEFAYLSKGKEGFEIINCEDPLNITSVADVKDIPAYDIGVSGSLILIAGGGEGLILGNVSKDGVFQEITRIDSLEPLRVSVEDSTALLVDRKGLTGVRFSDPENPEILGFYETDSCEDAVVRGNYAYLAEGYLGLTVLDISNLKYPLKVSVCDEIFAFGVDVDKDERETPASYAYITDSIGLNAIEIHIPDWLK